MKGYEEGIVTEKANYKLGFIISSLKEILIDFL